MVDVIKQLESNIIVPVVVFNNIEDAIPVAKALYDGGIYCIEVTYRSDIASQCIAMIRHEMPQMLVGAGTILNIEQLNQAIQADAHFIVTPGMNEKIIKEAQNKNIPIIPGVSSASDCDKAIEYNITYVKFFPSEQLGGLSMIKALSGPYKTLKFMPTGGISFEHVSDYLKEKFIFAIGGSWLVKQDWLDNKNYSLIKEEARKTMIKALDLEFSHVMVNNANLNPSKKDKFTLFDIVGHSSSNDMVIFDGKTIIEHSTLASSKHNQSIVMITSRINYVHSHLLKVGVKIHTEFDFIYPAQLKRIIINNYLDQYDVHIMSK